MLSRWSPQGGRTWTGPSTGRYCAAEKRDPLGLPPRPRASAHSQPGTSSGGPSACGDGAGAVSRVGGAIAQQYRSDARMAPLTPGPRSGQSEPGRRLSRAVSRKSPIDHRQPQARDGAGAPGGPPKAEPGAGSAGRGAAQRRRLDLGTAQFGNGSCRQWRDDKDLCHRQERGPPPGDHPARQEVSEHGFLGAESGSSGHSRCS